MEEYRKHDKKKKNTTGMPLAVNMGAGAGSLGMGGILLFGGALVTATIVSAALAFKTRRSSKKSRSPSPSPELQSVDAPGQLEFTGKTDKDHSLDSQNQSDGVTSMKEMQTKTKSMQELSREEKQNWDEKVEAEEIIMLSVVGEDEERYVGCVFDEKMEEGYGVGDGDGDSGGVVLDKIKMAVECEEEQVDVAGDETELELASEEDSCSETETVDGGELYSNGNKEQQSEGDETEKWLVSGEDVDVAGMEECEAMEVEVETVEDEEAAMEGACENQVTEEKDKDCGDDTQTVCVGEEDEISVLAVTKQQGQGQGQGQGQAGDEIAIQDHQSQTFPSGGSGDETAAQDEMVHKGKQAAEMMMEDDVQESLKSNGDAASAMQANIHNIQERMPTILHKNDSDHNKQKGACIYHYHYYSELLPWFTEISMVPSLLLIFILLALGTALRTWSSNHTTPLQ